MFYIFVTLSEHVLYFQVFIFYGDRSNAEFLVHNGFIYSENDYDKLNIKLGEYYAQYY